MSTIAVSRELWGATMGMAIVDDNEYEDGREGQRNVLGGAGVYWLVGCRLFGGRANRHRVGGVIDLGRDFPAAALRQIQLWDMAHVVLREGDRLTTRGVNYYDNHGVRHFAYKTPKRQIFTADLVECELVPCQWVHLICLAARAAEFILELTELDPTVKFIYEPLPTDCLPNNLEAMAKLIPHIDVFTPNWEEASSLCSDILADDASVKAVAATFASYQKPNSVVVIRQGAKGAYMVQSGQQDGVQLPAYHLDQARVIDVTGGGNSFCGGFVAGYQMSGGDWVAAAVAGNIVSGCVIEALAMPELTVNDDGVELWNNLTTAERLRRYREQNPHLNFELNIPS